MTGIDISKLNTKTNNNPPKKDSMFDFMDKDISLFGSKLSDKIKEEFYSELGILLEAGVDIRTTLDMIIEGLKKQSEKEVFKSILKGVIDGESLSESLKSQNKFSDYEIFSIQIGEETGKLPKVLKELGKHFHAKIKQRKQIVSAMSYPVLVIFTAFGAIGFMFYFIVPMFSDVFKRFDGELPWITMKVITLSESFSDNILYIIGSFLIVVITPFFVKEKRWYKKISSFILLKIPFFGEMVRMSYMNRFCQNMNLMISSKIPLLRAVGMLKKMIGFYPIEENLTIVEEDILQGVSLNESLRKFDIYDRKMTSLLKVGEDINQLDIFFGKLSNQYSDEVEYKTTLLGSVIEPVLIIFLGVLVGIILVSMYLPLFQLSSNFG